MNLKDFLEKQILFDDDEEDGPHMFAAVHAIIQNRASMIPANLLPLLEQALQPPEPQQRRVWALDRSAAGIWDQMEQVWPGLPNGMIEEKYYEYFRMNRHGFDTIYDAIRGK